LLPSAKMKAMSRPQTVSVIIPAYNEAKQIGGCLSALQKQTVQPLEIIVVDNNSTDTTAEIACSFPGVTVLSESRQGIGCARNRGFEAAKGDIIARLDADTIPANNWVESVSERFSIEPQIDAIGGPSAPKELCFLGTKTAAKLYGLFRHWHEQSIGVHPMMYGCNMALRRTAWEEIAEQTSPDDREIAEDVEITILLKKARYIVGYEPGMMIRFAWVRGLKPKKLRSYYDHDNHTLSKHNYGNPDRRK
jgi:glycosyltransferase involved in cell wall biosynthesis